MFHPQVSVVSSGVGSTAGACLGLAESRAAPPRITQWMTTYMQETGTDARLVCRAQGPGTLEVFWMGPNDEVSSGLGIGCENPVFEYDEYDHYLAVLGFCYILEVISYFRLC